MMIGHYGRWSFLIFGTKVKESFKGAVCGFREEIQTCHFNIYNINEVII